MRDETRQRIQDAALRLIARDGFDEVTVEQLASEAGVSHMTFFRYFPTKEAVVVSDPYDPVIADAVSAQPRDLAPLERVRRGLSEVAMRLGEAADDSARARIRIGVSHPRLRAAMWENNHRTESMLVAVLTSSGVDALEARAVVGACLGALMAALVVWACDDADEALADRVVSALSYLEVA